MTLGSKLTKNEGGGVKFEIYWTDVINKFWWSNTMSWAFWLDVAGHMTILNQSEYFMLSEHNYAVLSRAFWLDIPSHMTIFNQSEYEFS